MDDRASVHHTGLFYFCQFGGFGYALKPFGTPLDACICVHFNIHSPHKSIAACGMKKKKKDSKQVLLMLVNIHERHSHGLEMTLEL